MLRKLYIDNYKCLVNFEIALGHVCLLLGRNGVGKSSVFDVVFAIRMLLSGLAKVSDPDIFPPSTLTRWQTGCRQTIEMSVELEGECLTYRLEIEHEEQRRRARVAHESLTAAGGALFTFLAGEIQLYKDDHSKGPTFTADWSESGLARIAPVRDNKRLTRFLDWARKLLVCGLYPRSFETETSSEDAVLERDGRNFSAWYRHIFQERQDLVPGYVEALKRIIPGFEGVSLERAGRETRAFVARMREHGESFTLALHEMSDGQRALLAIYALVHITAGQGYTLFLDEPDNYVATVEIQPWLDAISEAAGDTIPQAVIASHHPELIDYFSLDRTLTFVREESGATRVNSPDPTQLTPGMRLSELVARGWAL
ncbi:MAG: ATP-binding protein [Planctomycetes bacterium]|nr:ATP-binding protein [Planctomycetota bacterium]